MDITRRSRRPHLAPQREQPRVARRARQQLEAQVLQVRLLLPGAREEHARVGLHEKAGRTLLTGRRRLPASVVDGELAQGKGEEGRGGEGGGRVGGGGRL